ncbi:hypothetical protein ACF0H5_008474 [Mactra antiquata]
MLRVLILSIIIACSHGIDRTKLWKIPSPMKGFQLQYALGRWFVQYRVAPCSWEGSNEFQDYELFDSLVSKNFMSVIFTMRNGVCNTINASAFLTSQPGVIMLKDPLGNNFSGKLIYLATDYMSFKIIYICTRMSVLGDKCNDAGLSVYTRMVKPDGKTIAKINAVLMKMYGVTVDQLQRVIHSKSCIDKQTLLNHKATQWW